jgi:diacylglycerol kinase (ATP)
MLSIFPHPVFEHTSTMDGAERAEGTAGPRRTLVIVNPVAGHRRGAAVWRHAEPALRAAAPDLELQTTTMPGHAEALAAEWEQAHPHGLLLVVGGDGTVHEVVNGLLRDGSTTTLLGLVPAGTGDDFARCTGTPLDPKAAVERLSGFLQCSTRATTREETATATTFRVDLGRLRFREPGGTARSRVFLNSVSLGLAPRGNRLARAMGRVVPGRLRYPMGGMAALLAGTPERYRVTEQGVVRFEGEALNLTIANGPTFGGGLRISPASSLTDGVLEQVIIGRLSLVRALTALARLYGGTHVAMRGVSVDPVRGALTIENEAAVLLVEADGQELEAAGGLTVEPMPGALTLLA